MMSFNRPDFYDETLVNPNQFAVSHSIKTKVFSQREPAETAEPNNNLDNKQPRPWRISFGIEASRVELVFEVTDTITIGRSSKEDQPYDGIDLAPFNGYELGVSRYHAELNLKNEQIVIIDKDSANGILLNQERLRPGISYHVKHGDKICFGDMMVNIRFLTSSFEIK